MPGKLSRSVFWVESLSLLFKTDHKEVLGRVKIKSFTMTQQSFKSIILNDQGVKLVMFDTVVFEVFLYTVKFRSSLECIFWGIKG